MLASESHKPIIVPLNIMSGTRMREVSDNDTFTMDSPFSSSDTTGKRELSVNPHKGPSSPKIFAIKFIYLQQLYFTKVLKVGRGYSDSFYKVALSSNMNKSASICWLQHQPQGWCILLGPELDERLKQAITSAIECKEELA